MLTASIVRQRALAFLPKASVLSSWDDISGRTGNPTRAGVVRLGTVERFGAHAGGWGRRVVRRGTRLVR